MDNVELESKVLELIKENNYFEMMMKAKEFEPEYKKSDFYKATKKPLEVVLKEAQLYYAIQLKDLGEKLQNLINTLSLEKLSGLMDQLGAIFTQENEEIAENMELLKEFTKNN